MTYFILRHVWIVLILAPLLVSAQYLAPPPLEVLTPDEVFRALDVDATSYRIISLLQSFGSDLWSRFSSSRGGAALEDVKAKTGIDLAQFFSFVFRILGYLFLQMYAILSDVAAKLGAPR